VKCGVAAQRGPQHNSTSRDKLLLSRQLEHQHARDLTATHRKIQRTRHLCLSTELGLAISRKVYQKYLYKKNLTHFCINRCLQTLWILRVKWLKAAKTITAIGAAL